MHNLLTRQMRRHFGDDFLTPPEWQGLLALISQAYEQSDADRQMLARSLELSSQELKEMYLAEKESILRQQLEDLKTERQRFKTLADNVPAGVLRLNSDWNCDFVNQEWINITSLTAAEAAGHGWWNSIHPDDLKLFRGFYDHLIQTGTAFACEFRIKNPTVNELWVYCTAIAEHQDEAGLSGHIFCMVNITERKNSLKQIERSQRLESIGVLAGGIAHDLNNALAPIQVGLDLIGKNHSPQDQRLLEIIAMSTQRSSDLVRNLITFARGGEGIKNSVSLDSVIKELTLVVRASFPKNIEVVTRMADPLPDILANFTQLHQVLLNLAVNARDAMPEGGRLTFEASLIRIEIATKGTLAVLKPGAYLRISVVDTGSGMTPEVLDHMFEPFFTTKKNGTGFGLSNVAGIIKEHKGDIRVYSLQGRGTTFHLYLPVQEASPASIPRPASPAMADGGGRLVLVVDDEENIRDLLKLVLRKSNYQVIEAINGIEALVKVDELKDRLNFIITDMHMPQLNGLGLIRKVKPLLPTLPIIVMTGRLETDEHEELQAQNITTILEKPFSPQALLAALR